MKNRSDYKTCPLCGASLDAGEVCDCEQEVKKSILADFIFKMSHTCIGCRHNSEPQASIGNCKILTDNL